MDYRDTVFISYVLVSTVFINAIAGLDNKKWFLYKNKVKKLYEVLIIAVDY